MAKKGVAKIIGNQSPIVGEKQIYSIESWYPDTPFIERNPQNVTWELFKKRKWPKKVLQKLLEINLLW